MNIDLIIAMAGSPPRPDRPFAITAQSNSITIGWSTSCDGGHTLSSFTVQYAEITDNDYYDYYYYFYYYPYPYPYHYSYRYIRNIDSTLRNYTITGLLPSTEYSFSVLAASLYARTSSYSSQVSITTLPPGKQSPQL